MRAWHPASRRLRSAVGGQHASVVPHGRVPNCGLDTDVCCATRDNQEMRTKGRRSCIELCIIKGTPSPLGDDRLTLTWKQFWNDLRIPITFDMNTALLPAGRDH